MRKIKKIVDLSWEFTAETPIYPGDPEPSVTVATTLENEGYNLSTLVMGTQTGTHVDAPYHFSNSGETIDNMELDFFLGEAVVVRVTDKKADEAITLEDIEPYKEEICEGKIVLFNTNWYKTRGTDEFFHHPYVNGDVAKYLVDNGVRFIGIDTINADQTGGTEFPVHDLFSEKRLMIGENWAFFDQIDFERPYIIALPMKLIGCDGSPERFADIADAMGIEREESMSDEQYALKAVEYVKALNRKLNIPTIKEIKGITEERFEAIAERSANNVLSNDNARKITKEDYLELLKKAYNE